MKILSLLTICAIFSGCGAGGSSGSSDQAAGTFIPTVVKSDDSNFKFDKTSVWTDGDEYYAKVKFITPVTNVSGRTLCSISLDDSSVPAAKSLFPGLTYITTSEKTFTSERSTYDRRNCLMQDETGYFLQDGYFEGSIANVMVSQFEVVTIKYTEVQEGFQVSRQPTFEHQFSAADDNSKLEVKNTGKTSFTAMMPVVIIFNDKNEPVNYDSLLSTDEAQPNDINPGETFVFSNTIYFGSTLSPDTKTKVLFR